MPWMLLQNKTLVFVVLLGLSVSLNVWLFRVVAQSEIKCRAAAELLVEQNHAAVEKARADTAAELASGAIEDREKLLADWKAIAERGQVVRTVYREKVKTLPALTCAPGAERMVIVNEILR